VITVGGVAISTPSSLQVGIQDLSKAERNANGTLVIERIATKRKLELGWSYLSQSDLAALFAAVSPVTFTVVYPDPQTGAARSGTFYAGDRLAGMIDYQNGVPRYKDMKFNLVEI
jgi:hypothetical protein